MRVAIAGGGIGGLATALCLADAGHEVVVVDRAADIGDVGAGIQISPNAGAVLDALGLGDDFARIATFPQRIVLRRWSDDSILRSTILGSEFHERFGRPYANVHRGDLARLLAGALASRHGVEVKLGTAVTDCTVGDDRRRPTLVASDGSTFEADVVVGADGIHSAVRRSVFGEAPARFSGAVAYRALVARDELGDVPLEVTNRLGPGAHVVSYLIGGDDHLLNLVCIVPETSWTVESWTEPGSADDLRAAFSGWSEGLQRILERVREPVYRWALHDRDPLDRWVSGAVALLGDACHPMLPFMAQGACQAIEDAWVLARALGTAGTMPPFGEISAALHRYESDRHQRTARIQGLSRRNRDMFHLADGEAQRRRDLALGGGGGLDEMEWLYGHDVTARQGNSPEPS